MRYWYSIKTIIIIIIILKQNDSKESEKAGARNLIQSDLKLDKYYTLHN